MISRFNLIQQAQGRARSGSSILTSPRRPNIQGTLPSTATPTPVAGNSGNFSLNDVFSAFNRADERLLKFPVDGRTHDPGDGQLTRLELQARLTVTSNLAAVRRPNSPEGLQASQDRQVIQFLLQNFDAIAGSSSQSITRQEIQAVAARDGNNTFLSLGDIA